MRSLFFIANWKMHKTRREALSFVQEIQTHDMPADRTIVLAASFPLLPALGDAVHTMPLQLAAQNMHWKEDGAFTGEVSPLQVRDAGCSFVILGHSERRNIFGETNDVLNKKNRAALAHNLAPIYCVGETLTERDAGRAKESVATQLEEGLAGISDEQRTSMIVAYEPVWAIGTGRTATPAQAQEMHAIIRTMLPNTALLYGGSVKPDNAQELLNEPDIDGFLVGGASLDPQSFAAICKTSSF